MLLCMRTTLDIKDDLLIRARIEAAKSGRTLTAIIEDALRSLFHPAAPPTRRRYRFRPPVIRDAGPPRVDIANRSALHDFMDRNF